MIDRQPRSRICPDGMGNCDAIYSHFPAVMSTNILPQYLTVPQELLSQAYKVAHNEAPISSFTDLTGQRHRMAGRTYLI